MANIASCRSKFIKLIPNRSSVISIISINKRNLISVANGGANYRKQTYDYMSKGWPMSRFWDRTHWYLNENSKIISIEGNLGVGKYAVAKKLADIFDMNATRDTTEEDLWILKSFREPIDFRDHNEILPDNAKYYTMDMFWNDPNPIENGRPLNLQYRLYLDRYYKYCEAMCHLFNTGRGSFIDRGPHSDYVMGKAFVDCGLMSQKAYDWLYFARRNTAPLLWKPHAVVYLRAPVDMVRKNINERNVPWEVKARNLTDKFLESYQHHLENDFLQRMKDYSEVMEVDLQDFNVNSDADIYFLADRLALLDLDGEGLDDLDKKFHQWKDGTHNRDAMDLSRAKWSSMLTSFMTKFLNIHRPRTLTEGKYSYEEYLMQMDVMNRDPRTDYRLGDDPDKDSVIRRLVMGPHHRTNYNYEGPKNFFWS